MYEGVNLQGHYFGEGADTMWQVIGIQNGTEEDIVTWAFMWGGNRTSPALEMGDAKVEMTRHTMLLPVRGGKHTDCLETGV